MGWSQNLKRWTERIWKVLKMSDVSHKIAVWLDEIRSEQVKNTIFFSLLKVL